MRLIKILGVLILISKAAFGQTELEKKQNRINKFYKAYRLSFNENPSANNSLLQQVSDGSMSAADAAKELLKAGNLDNMGMLVNDNKQGRALLDNTIRLFNSFFPSLDVSSAGSNIEVIQSRNIYDVGVGRYFAKSVLSFPYNFEQAFTGSSALSVSRSSQFGTRFTEDTVLGPLSYNNLIGNYLDQLQPLGQPRGIISDNINLSFTSSEDGQSYNLIKHVGEGGFLGSANHLLSLGARAFQTNGAEQVPRKQTLDLLESLLNRKLPILTADHAAEWAQMCNSGPSFKTQVSCETCHASMDNLAGAFRNFHRELPNDHNNKVPVIHPSTYDSSVTGLEELPCDGDSNYYKAEPYGRLVFSSAIDGSYHNVKVLGIGELGSVLSNSNDVKLGLISHIFESLTGIRVEIRNTNDPNAQAYTVQELQVIAFLKDLATTPDIDYPSIYSKIVGSEYL